MRSQRTGPGEPAGASRTIAAAPEPQPSPGPRPAPAVRLGTASWRNGRLVLGVLLVLVAVLGGALVLQRAQHLTPVYVATRDLPSGTRLAPGDLAVRGVRFADEQLRAYLHPAAGQPYVGQVLVGPVRKGLYVPAAAVSGRRGAARLVKLAIKVEQGDLAQGLRPGDHVAVIAAYTDGVQKGTARVLLPVAEVDQVVKDTAALGGDGRETGVQVWAPGDRAVAVAAAETTARILVLAVPAGGLAVPAGGLADRPDGSVVPAGPAAVPPTATTLPAPAGRADGARTPAAAPTPASVPRLPTPATP